MLTDEQLTAELLALFRKFMEDNEAFEMMQIAACDEINRSLDEGDLVGELRGRFYQAICDAVAQHR